MRLYSGRNRLIIAALLGGSLLGGMAVMGQSRMSRDALRTPAPSTRLRTLKPMRSQHRLYPALGDYMRILERMPAYVERGWRAPGKSGHPVGFFGDPDHAEMGLRSMGNVVMALALLASEPGYDPRVTGLSADWCFQRARDCLAYMTRGHVSGDLTCADGKPWGNHWQSAWWTAKMAIGATLIWDRLTSDERRAVHRVVAHEADRHLGRRAPGGELSNTRSEENAWDTEVLAAALALMPEHAHASAWRAKLIEFAANSLSAPQDAHETRLLDGRPLNEHVYTANVHRDFTIENHGAYHACYMACPLHSLTWGYYAMEAAGQLPPEAQFHHFGDVWNRLKPTFLTHRFAYPSGKDWPRYAYGSSFIMPALVLLQYRFDDREARYIERQRVIALETEQIANGDGGFYSRRFTRNIMIDRNAEYETDTYANLALCYLLHKRFGPPGAAMSATQIRSRLRDAHVSDEAGLAYVRDRKAFASLAWRRLDGPFPTALFLPIDRDDLAEWGIGNLVGRIAVDGVDPARTRTSYTAKAGDGILDAHASLTYVSRTGTPLYTHDIAFQADCLHGRATVAYRFTADGPIEVKLREGLRLHVANSLFNGYQRVWRHDGPRMRQLFSPTEPPPERETLREIRFVGPAVNVDETLGIADLTRKGDFRLRVSDRGNAPWGSMNYAVLDCPPMDTQARQYAAGETILTGRFLVVLGTYRETRTALNAVREDGAGSPR